MPQRRFSNFGETATAASENLRHNKVLPKGVYEGFDLSVELLTTNLSIGIGAGVQHNGVIWIEDTVGVTVVFTAPASAENFTVVATHDNRSIFGGVSIDYELQGGILSSDSITNGVVLGWIRHPGGAVPLDPSHIQVAPKQKASLYSELLVQTAPIELVPPYVRGFEDLAGAGVDITFTDRIFDVSTFTMHQQIERSPAGAPGIQTLVQHIQFYTPPEGHRPFGFDFWLNFVAAPTREVRVEVYDTNQSPVTIVSGTPILSTAGWEQKSVEVSLASGTFDPLKPWTLRLTFQLDQGGTIKHGRTLMRMFPFP